MATKRIDDSTVNNFYNSSPDEQHRLHEQHYLFTAALHDRLVLIPGADDLFARPGLRVLDNAAADGFWLRELRRLELTKPEEAELVAADIVPYPEEGMTEDGILLTKHDMKAEWPKEWEGTFHLVHQRACVAFFPSWPTAVTATRRLLDLVRPGGWIQLVDTVAPHGKILSSDPPHVRLFKTITALQPDIKPPIGARLDQLLSEAAAEGGIELADVGKRSFSMQWGKGSKTKELEEMGVEAIEALAKNVGKLWEMSPATRGAGKEELESLTDEAGVEVRVLGFELPIHVVWARKKA